MFSLLGRCVAESWLYKRMTSDTDFSWDNMMRSPAKYSTVVMMILMLILMMSNLICFNNDHHD